MIYSEPVRHVPLAAGLLGRGHPLAARAGIIERIGIVRVRHDGAVTLGARRQRDVPPVSVVVVAPVVLALLRGPRVPPRAVGRLIPDIPRGSEGLFPHRAVQLVPPHVGANVRVLETISQKFVAGSIPRINLSLDRRHALGVRAACAAVQEALSIRRPRAVLLSPGPRKMLQDSGSTNDNARPRESKSNL
jgi:hypothetical protein